MLCNGANIFLKIIATTDRIEQGIKVKKVKDPLKTRSKRNIFNKKKSLM
jgi:hypothetical protein